jgi:hypothetical protein
MDTHNMRLLWYLFCYYLSCKNMMDLSFPWLSRNNERGLMDKLLLNEYPILVWMELEDSDSLNVLLVSKYPIRKQTHAVKQLKTLKH